MLAVGCRPRYLEHLSEAENHLCITSDDLFSLEENPGKTLIIGGGYIAVECASFLSEMGNEIIMINRSSFLRTFDQDASTRIINSLSEHGVKTLEQTTITKITKLDTLDSHGMQILEVDLMTGDTP